jgi:hypothetical protein
MVAVTLAGVAGWTLAIWVAAVAVAMAGTYALAKLRIWWARQMGRGVMPALRAALTVQLGWLWQMRWTLRVPVGFFHVCAWRGRDQPEGL